MKNELVLEADKLSPEQAQSNSEFAVLTLTKYPEDTWFGGLSRRLFEGFQSMKLLGSFVSSDVRCPQHLIVRIGPAKSEAEEREIVSQLLGDFDRYTYERRPRKRLPFQPHDLTGHYDPEEELARHLASPEGERLRKHKRHGPDEVRVWQPD